MKRTKATTAAAAIEDAMNAVLGPPECPAHVTLRPRDLPFWDGVVRARARDEWIDADLVVGAQLARCQADIEVESALLDDEGTVVRNDRGTQIANPRVSVLEQLSRRELALMRTLRLGGAAAGEARHVIARRKTAREAEKAHAQLADEDLLA
jgi:hypothetical protein